MVLLLTDSDLRPLLDDPASMVTAIDAVEQAFREHQKRQGQSLPWVHLQLRRERALLRVQLGISAANGVAIRTYPLFPGARSLADRHIIMLLDPDAGQLLALMAGEDLAVFRTGAPAGVACRYLAPPSPKVLAILGSGRQARGQALAIRQALPSLQLVRVFSPSAAHRERFAREMTERLGLPVVAVESAHQCVDKADVVDVATNSRTPVLEADWVRPGALVISIASHQLPPELVLRAQVVVSSREALLEGERPREPYASMIRDGIWSTDRIVAEMGQIVLGEAGVRFGDSDTVLFEMPGMSIWDAAIAGWAYRWAVENGAGTSLTLSSPS